MESAGVRYLRTRCFCIRNRTSERSNNSCVNTVSTFHEVFSIYTLYTMHTLYTLYTHVYPVYLVYPQVTQALSWYHSTVPLKLQCLYGVKIPSKNFCILYTLYTLYTHVYPVYPVYPCIPCISCIPIYTLYTHVYLVYLVYPYLSRFLPFKNSYPWQFSPPPPVHLPPHIFPGSHPFSYLIIIEMTTYTKL